MITPETRDREKEKLLLTDAELIRRLGVPDDLGRRVLRYLDDKQTGFPRKQKIWGNRRWWPAVQKWLDLTCGMPSETDAARAAIPGLPIGMRRPVSPKP